MRLRNALATAALLASLAGCARDDGGTEGIASAGGTPTPSASSGQGDSGQDRESMLKYAQCMRDNGVPNFPDPEFEEGGGIGLILPEGVDKSKVDAAAPKCKQYLPNGGERRAADPERLEQSRKYSQCMRDNGFPDFPDPQEDGGIALEGDKFNPDDAKFKAADEKCREAHMPKRPGSGTVQKRSDT